MFLFSTACNDCFHDLHPLSGDFIFVAKKHLYLLMNVPTNPGLYKWWLLFFFFFCGGDLPFTMLCLVIGVSMIVVSLSACYTSLSWFLKSSHATTVSLQDNNILGTCRLAADKNSTGVSDQHNDYKTPLISLFILND